MADKESINPEILAKALEKALAKVMPVRVHGQASEHEEVSGNPILLGAKYSEGDPKYQNGKVGLLQIDEKGYLKTTLGSKEVKVSGDVTVSNLAFDKEGQVKVIVGRSALPVNAATQDEQKIANQALESLDKKLTLCDTSVLYAELQAQYDVLESINEKIGKCDTDKVTLKESAARIGIIGIDKDANTVQLGGTSPVIVEDGALTSVKSLGKIEESLPGGENLLGKVGFDPKNNTVTLEQTVNAEILGGTITKLNEIIGSLPPGTNLLGQVEIHGQVYIARDAQAKNIATNTTTTVKIGSGSLCSIVVNTAGQGSKATIYDNTSGGSGTKIATLDTSAIREVSYNCVLFTGLSIVTTGDTPADITVTYT